MSDMEYLLNTISLRQLQRRAIRREDHKASAALAWRYYYGLGGVAKPNSARAFYYAANAAHAGVYHAQLVMAALYIRGEHVTKNPLLARDWVERANLCADVEKPPTEARMALATCQLQGIGAEPDLLAGLGGLVLLAAEGHGGAITHLSRLMEMLAPLASTGKREERLQRIDWIARQGAASGQELLAVGMLADEAFSVLSDVALQGGVAAAA